MELGLGILLRAIALLALAALVTLFSIREKRLEFLIFRGVTSVFYPQYGWHTRGDGYDVLFTMAKLRERNFDKKNLLLEFNDDPERYFSNVPAEPIDYAVVLQNISQSMPKTVLIGSNLTWENTNEYALTALHAASAKIPRMIFSAVLSRSPQGSEMPESMRQASLPLHLLRGDSSALPVVNRLAFTNAYSGSGKAMCGFSLLEGIKPQGDRLPLLARWGDRVVFSSTLLFFLAEIDQSLADLDIEVGKVIRCGRDDSVIFIDEYGQLKLNGIRDQTNKKIMAHEFIDKNKSFDQLGSSAMESVMMMDFCQKQSDEVFQAQARMAMGIEAMRETKVLGGRINFRRVPEHVAWACSGIFAVLIAACSKRSQRVVVGLLTTGIWVLELCIFAYWVPYVPILSVIAFGILFPEKAAKKIRSV